MRVVSDEAVAAVRARSKGKCELRASPGCWGYAVSIHHRKLRRHHDHRPVNLLHTCVPCHTYAHDNPAEAYERGWLVHSWDDPAEVTVG